MARGNPLWARIVAALAALGALVFFAGMSTPFLWREGYRFSAAWFGATSILFAVVVGAVALTPAFAQRVLRRFSRVDLEDGGHVFAFVLLAASLFFVFGNGLGNGIYAIEAAMRGDAAADAAPTGMDVLVGVILNLVVLVLPVILWISFVHDTGPGGVARELGLDARDAPRQSLIGVAVAVGFILLIAAVAAVVSQFVHIPENERALDIAKGLDVGSALIVATGAALSEEIYFRGFLQRRIGVVAQAVLFSLAHLSYVNVLEIAVTFALGLAFGLIRRQTGSLWAPVAAHFAFDFLELLVAIYLPQSS